MKKSANKGFTIVELVIVISVIAILAAVLIPTFSGVVEKANQSAALQTAKNTLENTLPMSSVAQLQGKNTEKQYQTVIVVNGYAFGYNANQLEAIDYPGYQGTAALVKGATPNGSGNFNTIVVAAENLDEVYTEVTGLTYKQEKVEYKNLAEYNADHESSPLADEAAFTALSDKTKTAAVAGTDVSKYYTENSGVYTKCADKAEAIKDTKYYSFDGYKFDSSTFDVIKGATTIADNKVTLVDGTYYLNKTETAYDAIVLVNSDYSNKAVTFTTFAQSK